MRTGTWWWLLERSGVSRPPAACPVVLAATVGIAPHTTRLIAVPARRRTAPHAVHGTGRSRTAHDAAPTATGGPDRDLLPCRWRSWFRSAGEPGRERSRTRRAPVGSTS